MKPKLLNEFRVVTIHQGTISNNKDKFEANYCLECEEEIGRQYSKKDHDPAIRNFNEMKYTYAWIGKMSYKDLCKIYKIRYED